jgi:hypothetical protein
MQEVRKLPIIRPLVNRDTEPQSDLYRAAPCHRVKRPGPDFFKQRGLTIVHF